MARCRQLQIVAHVRDAVRPGSIVLLHLMSSQGQSSRAALPDVLRELKRPGFRFVTITDLVEDLAGQSAARSAAPEVGSRVVCGLRLAVFVVIVPDACAG